MTVPRTIVTPQHATDVNELYAEGRAAYAARRYSEAATLFDRLVEVDPQGALAERALFDAAAAHDDAGALDAAATRYEEVARRFPEGELARSALVRAVRLRAYLEHWDRAARSAEVLLARHRDLDAIEKTVAYSGKALALVAGAEPDAAAYFIEKGRDAVETARLDTAGQLPRDLAQLYFALGELRRIRAERIDFDPMPPNFLQSLEQRCQLLLDAQSAYSDAMRAYDAHWSAMAGYRVGELYKRLHEDLMRIPPPAAVDGDRKRDRRARLFEGAMRLRYAVLLDKGLAMMDHTVEMAERTGERSPWVERARQAKQQIEASRERERRVLATLPYSRADLERALEEVGRRAIRRKAVPAN